MTKETTIADLKRIQRGVLQRAERWNPVVLNLREAATIADTSTKSISKKMGGSLILSHPMNLELMSAVSLGVAHINGINASVFISDLCSPIMHGFFWFQAIFIAVHGREQTNYSLQQSRFRLGSDAAVFQELDLPKNTALEYDREFNRLVRAIEAEKSEMPPSDAEKAVSAMLLAPIFFPPVQIPTVEAIALQIEWCQWQVLLSRVAENIYLDDLASKVYEHPPKTDLDILFSRLSTLVLTASRLGIRLSGIPAMSDLSSLRRGLEQRTLTQSSFNVPPPPYEIPVGVNFPNLVTNFLKAHGFAELQKVYLSNQHMTFALANL